MNRPRAPRLLLSPSAALTLAGLTLTAVSPAAAQLHPGSGLSAMRSQFLTEPIEGTHAPDPFDRFALALAAGDFDADGVEDLASGIPGDDCPTGTGLIADCGRVLVQFGVPGVGLQGEHRFLDLGAPGSPSGLRAGDLYGRALASGDFNGDLRADLAVAAPTTFSFPDPRPGAVFVHYGMPSPERLQAAPEHRLEIEQTISVGNPWFFRFGATLAVGDFDGDGFDDLAIGDPSWNNQRGAVVVAHGGKTGLMPFDGYLIHQDEPGIPDQLDFEDFFASAMAAGDFNADGFDDLAIGAPGEDDCGAVLVLFGSPNSLIFANHYWLGEVDLGGACESADQLGVALAAGDLNGDGFDELVIGVPGQNDSDGDLDIGMVGVLYGAPGSPMSVPAGGFNFAAMIWWWESLLPEIASFTTESENGDRFGAAVAVADFDADGFGDLVVGVPGQDNGAVDRGRIYVLSGNQGLNLFPVSAFETGINGVPGPGTTVGGLRSQLGFPLAGGDFDGDGHDDLAAGLTLFDAPQEDAGAAILLYGALFANGFESGSIEHWATHEN